jgi:hypothetical protein
MDLPVPESLACVALHEPEYVDMGSIGCKLYVYRRDPAGMDEAALEEAGFPASDYARFATWEAALDEAGGDSEEARRLYDADGEQALAAARAAAREDEAEKWPMMNQVWPCEPHGIDCRRAANLIAEHASNCALVRLSRDGRKDMTGIAVLGAGQDYNWDVATAFACCGHVPPARLLYDLQQFAGRPDGRSGLMAACADAAAEFMRARAEGLEERAARLRREAGERSGPGMAP